LIFSFAAVAGVAASAVIAFFLTNLIIGQFRNSDRLSRWSSVASGTRKERHTSHRAIGALSAFLVAKLKLAG
jgi:hypothetical protein